MDKDDFKNGYFFLYSFFLEMVNNLNFIIKKNEGNMLGFWNYLGWKLGDDM